MVTIQLIMMQCTIGPLRARRSVRADLPALLQRPGGLIIVTHIIVRILLIIDTDNMVLIIVILMQLITVIAVAIVTLEGFSGVPRNGGHKQHLVR